MCGAQAAVLASTRYAEEDMPPQQRTQARCIRRLMELHAHGMAMQQRRPEQGGKRRRLKHFAARYDSRLKLFAAGCDSRQLASAQIFAHLVDSQQRVVQATFAPSLKIYVHKLALHVRSRSAGLALEGVRKLTHKHLKKEKTT